MKSVDGKTFSAYVRSKLHSSYITVNIGPAEMSENSHKIVKNILNIKLLKVGLYLQIFKAFYLKEIDTMSCQ